MNSKDIMTPCWSRCDPFCIECKSCLINHECKDDTMTRELDEIVKEGDDATPERRMPKLPR